VSARPLRADAQRNRERLLDAAVRAFSHDGQDVTLDAIAKDAGVGIGTLYRHFPTREALVDAAYQNELARLCDGVTDLLATMPPDTAARTWMDRFIDYMATKRGMADALGAVIASGGNPYANSKDRLMSAITALLAAGTDAGTIRSDVEPLEILAWMGGVSMMGEFVSREVAGRMIDLLMDGLHHGAKKPLAPHRTS
jgi:AcrR family transcriptional regulator